MIKIENGYFQVKGSTSFIIGELLTIINAIGGASNSEEETESFRCMLLAFVKDTNFTKEDLDKYLDSISEIVKEVESETGTIEDIINKHNKKIGGQK